MKSGWWMAAAALSLAALAACDPQAVKETDEGVSTEADVRARFGEPERVWNESDGSRTFEYNRQPAGVRNYMITIGTDGKVSALRQVLTPENFARITPGMGAEEVRRRLGKPARQVPYKLKNEVEWTWKFLEPPNTEKGFTVVFSAGDLRVLRTEIGLPPDAPESRGGG